MKSIDAKTLDQLITEMNEMNRWFAKVVKYWDDFSNGGDGSKALKENGPGISRDSPVDKDGDDQDGAGEEEQGEEEADVEGDEAAGDEAVGDEDAEDKAAGEEAGGEEGEEAGEEQEEKRV